MLKVGIHVAVLLTEFRVDFSWQRTSEVHRDVL